MQNANDGGADAYIRIPENPESIFALLSNGTDCLYRMSSKCGWMFPIILRAAKPRRM